MSEYEKTEIEKSNKNSEKKYEKLFDKSVEAYLLLEKKYDELIKNISKLIKE